ncbi:MAG: hypothetical protein LBQ59_00775 [Candidatus Peribacteria bacterium]|nr:hypothetical protein [Candidatus Peribacteria bacterium]
MQKNGFEIIDKTFYKDHSIFYTCVKNQKVENVKYENKYEEYKKIFMDYVDSYEELIKSFNERIEKFD